MEFNTELQKSIIQKTIFALNIGIIVLFVLIELLSSPKQQAPQAKVHTLQLTPQKKTSYPLQLAAVAQASSKSAQTTITPVITVSPSLTETPVNLGYCLHVPVLIYHHIEPIAQAKEEGHGSLTVDNGIFDNQMKYLAEHGYRGISASELIHAIKSHGSVGKAVVVTLDDGYNDAFTYAYPSAKKYGITLNLFIITGLMENSGYLNWGQLKEMVDSGMVKAYNHTWSHYSLGNGSADKNRSEISQAKQQLNQHLGSTEDIIAYPYGSYSATTVAITSQLGFTGGFTTKPGSMQCEGAILTLPRIHIGNAPLSSYGL